MMQDDKLAAEENRRIAQHEEIKSQVKSDVNAEIVERAERVAPDEAQTFDKVAGEFRNKAVAEVVETEREVERSRTVARLSQVVDYIFYVIYALLALRLLLALLAARREAGFTQLVFSITDPLYAPFRGIVASPSAGGYTLALPVVIAIIVYALLHAGINGLLRLIAHRKTQI
jgi:uncharacterized protein YggT (Ycf19 family)